jgi:hypothetical protein
MIRSCIYHVDKNIRRAWVIYGDLGVWQYYGYTKRQSIERYRNECRNTFIYEQRKEVSNP